MWERAGKAERALVGPRQVEGATSRHTKSVDETSFLGGALRRIRSLGISEVGLGSVGAGEGARGFAG
jgi:hypothetical protein